MPKEKSTEIIEEKNQEYFITTYDEFGELVTYTSRNFKLSEIDMLSLIRILIIERRSLLIGNRLLSVYQDSTAHRQQITLDRLRKIGIDKENEKPQQTKNSKIR